VAHNCKASNALDLLLVIVTINVAEVVFGRVFKALPTHLQHEVSKVMLKIPKY